MGSIFIWFHRFDAVISQLSLESKIMSIRQLEVFKVNFEVPSPKKGQKTARAHDFRARNLNLRPQKWVFLQHSTFAKLIEVSKIPTPLLFFPVKADNVYFKNPEKWSPKWSPRSRYFALIEKNPSSFFKPRFLQSSHQYNFSLKKVIWNSTLFL